MATFVEMYVRPPTAPRRLAAVLGLAGLLLSGLVLSGCGTESPSARPPGPTTTLVDPAPPDEGGSEPAPSDEGGAEAGGSGSSGLRLVRVASGLDSPVHVAAPRNERNRLYVVEQAGRIRVLRNGRLLSAPLLDIRNLVGSGGERGLLSVAFHPAYASNRLFYVNYTDRAGTTRVVEYRSRPGRSPVRVRQLLSVRQPFSNHNGGQLAFGPEGDLYVGMGDGGGGGDPQDNAQDLSSRLGKLLRLDVDRPGAGWAVVAYGLRNPWRFSFDRATGDLYAGDVGQGEWEEIDYLRAGTRELVNFGWDVFEGTHRYEDKSANPAGRLLGPIVEYDHDQGCSVTGGFVYRGTAARNAVGRYFYGDYCSGRIWSLVVRNGRATNVRRHAFTVPALTSFGEDARGELHLVSREGEIFRLAER